MTLSCHCGNNMSTLIIHWGINHSDWAGGWILLLSVGGNRAVVGPVVVVGPGGLLLLLLQLLWAAGAKDWSQRSPHNCKCQEKHRVSKQKQKLRNALGILPHREMIALEEMFNKWVQSLALGLRPTLERLCLGLWLLFKMVCVSYYISE